MTLTRGARLGTSELIAFGGVWGLASLVVLGALRAEGGQTNQTSPARPTVVYGGNKASPPFEYLDKDGKPQGFNVELFRALANAAGRNAEIRLGVWSDIVAAVGRREVDVVTLGYAEARTADFDFLVETWTLRQSMFFPAGRTSYPTRTDQIHAEVVAVQEKSIVHELLLALPESERPNLRHAPNHLEALKLMISGQATAVAGNSLVLRTALDEAGIGGAIEVPIKAASYQLATGRGRGPEMAWIAPALQQLKDGGEFSRLVERHLAAQPRTPRWPIFAGALAAALLVGGMGAVGARLWNASLRLQVTARTSQLLAAAEEKDRLTASLVERETERERLIADLETKNAELERFSYTVSHDLKSPLVTIGSYVGLLEKSAREGDMATLSGDVARIQRAADRMRRLLDELLALSRVGRVVNPPEDVSLGELAREAAEMVKGRLSAGQIDIRIAANLPTVRGDRVRLLEVMLNLIDNAAKFAGNAATPRIEVGVAPDLPQPSFFVRDNGVGIDPEHQEKVFGLFDKLDPASEGTGIGLALVRRIVEAHGGRINIESKGRGEGTTFHVSLAPA